MSMYLFIKKAFLWCLLISSVILLSACSSTSTPKSQTSKIYKNRQLQQSGISGPNIVVKLLSQQKEEWKGTRYRLGGTTKKGVDCSGFTQTTFRDLFGISLPRMTVDQAKVGKKVSKSELQAGDLVFFKTGRGPNGLHVGIYVKNGQFLHASTKGGVMYSDMNSPYRLRTFWQARRI